MKREFAWAAVIAASLLAAGCADSRMHLSDDFGAAYKQDTMAQIANPDAKYKGDPAPGSNGVRVAAGQDRYVNGKVIAPEAARAANVPTGGAGSAGSGSSPQ
jgi:hypothetical protein